MKAQTLVVIMLLAGLPPTAAAQLPDPGDLPDPGEVPDPGELPDPGEVPDPDDLGTDAAFDEVFVPVERFPCPADAWKPNLLEGETSWVRSSHPRASDGCVAQWGTGSYRVGSEATLGSPELPTDHLATSSLAGAGAEGQNLNTLFDELVASGVNLDVAATLTASVADGCRAPLGLDEDAQGNQAPAGIAASACRNILRSGSQFIGVPDLKAGTGNLFLDLEHAYKFSQPDANNFALDGGWVEIRTPGGEWTRLNPVAAFALTDQGERVLCASTAPGAVFGQRVYNTGWQGLGDYIDDVDETLAGNSSGVLAPSTYLPASRSEWEADCKGIAHLAESGGGIDVQINGTEDSGETSPPGLGERFRPYPGVIRGEGRGFVGSTEDADGNLEFVEHWFDLTPYAGKTVEVRTHATAGPGGGQRTGGWWVDDVNVRYNGPPADLGLRLTHPGEGDSVPPGKLPTQVDVVNLGRTDSQPVKIEVSTANVTENITIPGLPPLAKFPAPVMLPLPDDGTHDVTAEIAGYAAEGETVPYADTFPRNDVSTRTVTVEELTDVDLRVTSIEEEDGTANITIEVRNNGNTPIIAPVQGTLVPVDGNTRLPRTSEATSLGVLDTVQVPHGEDVNSRGVANPVQTFSTSVELPEKGIWRVELSTSIDPAASATSAVGFGEAAPPALEEPLAAVAEGPTEEATRTGFELTSQSQSDDGEQPVLTEKLRDGVGGPETRVVPRGDFALASGGAELQHNYTPVDASSNPLKTTGIEDSLEGVSTPEPIQSPASLQAWNIREHRYAIYGVGTSTESSSGIGEQSSWEYFSDNDFLHPGKGESVFLELDHATQADWDDGYGSKARILLIPKGTVELESELRDVRNQSQEITSQLPPELGNIVEPLLYDTFFNLLLSTTDTATSTAGIERLPDDLCSDLLSTPVGGINALSPLCSDPKPLDTAAGACTAAGVDPDCDLTDEDVTGYAEFFDTVREVTGDNQTARVLAEFEDPSGWEKLRFNVTDLVDEKQPFYVVFDLQTTSDAEEVMASGEAGTDPEGTDYTVPFLGNQQSDTDVRVGWPHGEVPIWTVDDPHLVKEFRSQDRYRLDLCDAPEGENEGEYPACPEKDALPIVGQRGWRHMPANQTVDTQWRYEPLGGDPASLDPGALVWEGGTGELIWDDEGRSRLLFSHEDPDPYGVLELPPIDLSGYEQPVVRLHTQFGQVTRSTYGDETTVVQRCEDNRTSVDATVWTQTGWNVRVRPVNDDGEPLTEEATTVTPIGGYDDCSDVGQAPVLFDARGVIQQPQSLDAAGTRLGGGPFCFGAEARVDPLAYCRETMAQFGHKQPVFGLPQSWGDVNIDLSEFEGQKVQLEIHAFSVHGDGPDGGEPSPRGQLRVDTVTVQEGAPPVDLSANHKARPFIAPDTEERFNLEIENQGSEPIHQASIRRVILDDQGCVVDGRDDFQNPTVIQVGLVDPETGRSGLPPGETTVVQDTRLAWDAPRQERELFTRTFTVDPRSSLPISERPSFLVEDPGSTGRLEITPVDTDDCADDVSAQADPIGGFHGDYNADTSRDDGSIIIEGGPQSATRVQASDAQDRESLPLYATAPPRGLERAGVVDARVLQSPPGSQTEIRVEVPDQSTDEWDLVVPTPDGVKIFRDDEVTRLEDLPAGRYVGYVQFDTGSYQMVDFLVEEEPAPGRDASPGDNVASLRGETRARPQITIDEISLGDTLPVVGDAFEIPVTVNNTGNVPLNDVTTTVTVDPAGIQKTAERIPRLSPGDERTTVVNVTVNTASSQRISVHVTNQEGVSDQEGDRRLVLDSQAVEPTPGTHDGWERIDQDIVFGDGNRVPISANASLPLTGTMDLSRSPFSVLHLDHTADLEDRYDGVAVEWTDGDETFTHDLGTEPLTSSHAGAQRGETVEAITGAHDTPLSAFSTNATNTTMRLVDEVDVEEWHDRGSFELEVDNGVLDNGATFWLPTEPLLSSSSSPGDAAKKDVRHELRIALSEKQWCTLANEIVPSREPLRIHTKERRLFSEPSDQSRGWNASVRLDTGTFVRGSSSDVSAKLLQAEPVVPLPDQETTGWESVTYEIQLGDLFPIVERGLVPFSEEAGDDPAGCAGADDETTDTGTSIVLELRTESRSLSGHAAGALDLGWFVSQVEVPALGIDQAGAAQSNHELKSSQEAELDKEKCILEGRTFGSTPLVHGCTFITSADKVTALDMVADEDSDERIRTVQLSSNGATAPDGTGPTTCDESDPLSSLCALDDLLRPRPVHKDTDEGVLSTQPSDGDPRDRFTYVDASALVDLRSSKEGMLVLKLSDESTPALEGMLQVAGTAVPASEGEGEIAPARTTWETLPMLGNREVEERFPHLPLVEDPDSDEKRTPGSLCQQPADQPSPPLTPLGATRDRIVGPPTGDYQTLPVEDLGGATPEDQEVCVDLSNVAGHLALISLRIWLPGPEDSVEIESAEAWMPVPEPRKLTPQLRGLSDDTIHEGTYKLHNAEIRSLTPPFSHAVEAHVADTIETPGDDVLIPGGFPDLTFNVTQPGDITADWELTVHVEATFEDNATGQEWTVAGDVPRNNLPDRQDSFTGERSLTVPWEDLRMALTEVTAVDGEDPEEGIGDPEDLPDDGEIAWITESPILPSNVTEMNLSVVTEPTTLVDGTGDCPTDIERLQESTTLACRRLADLVKGDDRVELAFESLEEEPGVTGMRVVPERAVAGTPRTVFVELENPTPLPRELNGTLTFSNTEAGEEIGIRSIPNQVLHPFESTEVPVKFAWDAEDERGDESPFNERVTIEAEVGETELTDDYRTTSEHPSDDLLNSEAFFNTDGQVDRGPQWAKPAFAGEETDGEGFRIESPGGSQASWVTTNSISVDDLKSILHDEDAQPILAFQTQRQFSSGSVSDGEFTFATVAVSENGNPASGAVKLEGWTPSPTVERPESLTPEDPPQDRCTTSGGGAGGDNQKAAWGLEEDTPTVLRSTPGGLQPDVLDAWQTSVYALDLEEIESHAQGPPQGDNVAFSIIVADCDSAPAPGVMLVDQISLGSARPVVTIGEDEIPIQPGTTKRYLFEMDNPGPAGDTFRVVPSSTVPDGWQMQIETEDGKVLYDSATGKTQKVHLAQGETLEGVWRVTVPSGLTSGIQRSVPMTAYAIDAPGIASMGAMHGLVEHGPVTVDHAEDEDEPLDQPAEDEGRSVLTTSTSPQPDLEIVPDSVKVENAEVGREATVRMKVFNRGNAPADEIAIRAGVNGPAGFQELTGADGEDVVLDLPPATSKLVTFGWTPRAEGIHDLRIVADPGPDGSDLLLGGELHPFRGLANEKEECHPGISCLNVAELRLDVKPLQKPDLSVRVEGIPDRVPIGQPLEPKIIIENKGGRDATSATLTLSENGLLPILDSLTTDLPTVPAGEELVLTPTWTPVTPGEILVLASVSAPDDFSGERADGSLALEDNDATIPTTVDRAGVNVELSNQLRAEPGKAVRTDATITNEGTAPLRVLPEVVRAKGVLVSPLLDTALEIPPGESATVDLLAFALIGTQPKSVDLDLPLDPGKATVEVHVLESARANVELDRAPLAPGEDQLAARVVNQGNVPLEGTLTLDSPAITGSTRVDVPVDGTQNVTLNATVAPGTPAGSQLVTGTLDLDDGGELTTLHRLEVAHQAAVEVRSSVEQLRLSGSTPGTLTIENVGNARLDGRISLDGPVRLNGSAGLTLEPGETTERGIYWFSPVNQTGTATIEAFGGETLGSFEITGVPDDTGLRLLSISTRPSVNLQEGDEIQVIVSAENRGDDVLRNASLGVVVDGELQRTLQIEKLEPGQTTVASAPLELTFSGEVSLGVVDLTAFQRGQVAGPVTTLTIEDAPFFRFGLPTLGVIRG